MPTPVPIEVKDAEGNALGHLFAGINQAQFAKTHRFPGGASMISQNISGNRPISMDAALVYADGLGVSVGAFSTRLQDEINSIRAKSDGNISPDPSPTGLSVPLLANAGSMGLGEDQDEERVVRHLTVSPEWVARIVRPTRAHNLRFIHGYGDSMEPTFNDGDILLVDLGVQDVKIEGVYVLQAHDRIYIKRVRQRIDGRYEISSDNPTVKTVDVLDGTQQVTVMGRVVWRWNGRKM
jgi:phage repressor protein C with HTH and peptisase S24 domain